MRLHCKNLLHHIEWEQKGKRQHKCQKCGLYLYPSTQKKCPDFVPHGNVKKEKQDVR
jgi:hypothetical protein